MAQTIPGRFEYKKLSKYPHMKPADVEIWERFIISNPEFFDSVDYDFKVGEGQESPEGTPENFKKDIKDLSQKKIDVVGYRKDEIWIIEVKPVAGISAFGQVMIYQKLYAEQEKPTLPIMPTVIAKMISNDTKKMFDEFGIKIILV